MKILGISAYYHDSAAALIIDGKIIACAQEERFTRIKHDANFPTLAIQYCLKEGNIDLEEIDYVVFYDKPLLTFDRLLETYLTLAPSGFKSFLHAMPVWLKDKLFLKATLKKELSKLCKTKKRFSQPLLFTQHHQSHAASAFFASPFNEAAVLCLDGVGEWATTSLWIGKENTLTPKWQIKFPHSLGLLYSAFTYFTGFKVNSGEYKLMGLAPYGEPKYVDLILNNLIDVKEDGTYRLNMKYFDFATGLTMTNKHFAKLFGRPHRHPESEITQDDMDIARSIQAVTEEIVLRLAKSIKKEYQVNNLCLAGGVALNCVANGKIWQEKIFEGLWIQPAAGDAGGALGAALSVWYEHLGNQRNSTGLDYMQGSYLGPHFSNHEIKHYLENVGAKYHELLDIDVYNRTAHLLSQQKVVGWFQDRMEFGPRALGNRSILGDPRNQEMQSIMNLKIKFRESFRPFAPAVLFEKTKEWFDLNCDSPYMLLVAKVNDEKIISCNSKQLSGLEKLKATKSMISSVTHVDYSARVQTVHAETNYRFYQLLKSFENLTGFPILINTSFNVRGEPIVCTPEDAFRCFMTTHIDCLVLGNILLLKEEQPRSLRASFTEGEMVSSD
jgi:carbamoyltransferase